MEIPDFKKAKVLVVGDVMLDRYLNGSVHRISPEAPVPVVLFKDENDTIGGAANVAANVVSLGGECQLFGIVGNDEWGELMLKRCESRGIQAKLFTGNQPTITKTRVMASGQQIVRVDREERIQLSAESESQLIAELTASVAGRGAVIISDYGKGTISEKLLSALKEACSVAGVPLLIDPKGTDWRKYSGATLLSPNFKELKEASGTSIGNTDAEVAEVGASIKTQFNVENLLVTRSSKGMTLIGETVQHWKATAREVFDVSGAGDTVIATIGAALASGTELPKAIGLANEAAGQVIARSGTATISREELSNVLSQNARSAVVFTNGCFDVIHAGHIKLLEEARSHGSKLIVGLNSDDSVRRLKGESRPVNSQEDRKRILEALSCVDEVIVFEEDTPERLLSEIKPDILVKGSDYKVDEVVGREHAGTVVLIELLPDRSTTRILSKG